ANDLPGQVRALATAEGLGWEVQAELVGGAGLEDHWQRGSAQALIRSGHWDAVVLQQGPSSLPESRANLRQWAAQFDSLVRAAGGRSALYMVWPERSRLSAFDRVRDSYALAARDVSGWFLPAGEAWRAAWRGDPSLPFYGDDGLHPTAAGSYAAALTIFAGLSGRSPLGLPAPATVDLTTAERLQRAAEEALEQYRDYVPEDVP
ncbi:MAG TPA: SGNH/GDSL hydrolase family protein, partial [Gemmatimonadales bacterium]